MGETLEVVQEKSALTAAEFEESSIRFKMQKWADPEGVMRLPVKGYFKNFSIGLSRGLKEAQTLADLEGLEAVVSVDVTSIETDLELRNNNIKQAFFETELFPSASFSLTNVRVSPTDAQAVLVDALLDIHGASKEITDLPLHAERIDGAWHVSTIEPIVIVSDDFGLGAQALLMLCGHKGIDEFASVDVDLRITN
jgi:polyisoprenoid-binding protein YceI